MTLKNKIILFIIFTPLLNLYCQKSDMWINIDEPTTYKYYIGSQIIWIWDNGSDIEIDKKYYGFYKSRFLPSIDSLKTEGNYYFEVTADDFASENKDKKGHYRGIIAYAMEFSDDGNAFITYDIMRPGQQVTYKKVKTIPPKITDYLKSKGIVIPITNKNEKLKIKIPKSRIYTTPNVASKMFLVQGDEVSVLEKKSGWLHILYVTAKNKEIKGWIKKEDVGTE